MLVISLVIATSGLASVLIINNSAKQSYSSEQQYLIDNVSHQIVAKTSQQPLTKQDYAKLRRLGFDQLIALAQSRQHIYHQGKRVTNRAVDITGIDTLALASLSNINKASQPLNENTQQLYVSMSLSQGMAIVHPQLLAEILDASGQAESNINNGPFFLNNEQNNAANQALPMFVAVEQASLGNDLITDISEFYKLLPKEPLSRLLLVMPQSNANNQNNSALIESIKSALPPHLSLNALSLNEQQNDMTSSFHVNLMAMALLMFVVCLFIALNAVNLLINKRMPWYKICRQLGIPRRSIFIAQLLEISLITFISTCVGIYFSIYLSNLASPSVQATLEGLYNVEVGFGNTSLFGLFIQVFSISLCGSFAATLVPFWQSNQNLSSIKPLPLDASSSVNKAFWLAFLVFVFSAITIFIASSTLWLLLVATAFVILSGCCMLLATYPQIINALYALIPKRFPLLQLSTKQSIALSGKTKVACCAFFIAVTSNIGMNLMVDSFRGATLSWLDSRLASDYYFYYNDEQDINSLAREAGIELTPRFENTANYQGLSIQQYSYPSTDAFKEAMVFDKIDDIEKAWTAFTQNNGVFVNQQFAFHFNVKLNDTVNLPHPSNNTSQAYQVMGIIYDYGNPMKQVLHPLSEFDAQLSNTSIYAINGSPEGINRFKQMLDTANIDYSQTFLKTEQLLALSLNAFDRTFIITDGLNIVTLLIAALSLACAIIVLMDDLRPQNMLIRSLGVSALKTQLLALYQYLLLCIIALAIATPFGILLSWVLIYEINLQAFQWTYPLQINIANIFTIYGLSLAVVLIIISIPLIRASKKPLIEDIRWLN